MLSLETIREKTGDVKSSIKRRGLDVDVDRILELDEKRRELIPQVENLRAEQNQISDLRGKPDEETLERAKKVKKEIKDIEPKLEEVEEELDELLLEVPNLLHPSVPDGGGESDNQEIKRWGGNPKLSFEPLDHEELGRKLDIIDIEKASEVSGSGFYFLKGKGALLEMALLQFGMKFLVERGYTPMIVPEIVRGKVASGTGYIPRREEPDVYKIEGEDMWLSATAELPLTAYHMDEILEKGDLSKKYVGFSSCFRKEAGAYGKHKIGIYRVHQFDKLEIYEFVEGELKVSNSAFEEIISLEEELYKQLNIPYRVVNTCAGDSSAPAYLKYDLEYWSPVDETYREMTSCSNCTSFQARRLNIRYKDGDDINFVHTLNGTALTSTRTIIAILENFQQEDGSIVVPEVLRPYTSFSKI